MSLNWRYDWLGTSLHPAIIIAQFSKLQPDLLMFRSRKLINLKKMLFLKKQKMRQNVESSYSKAG